MALPGVCMSILNARNTKNGYGTFAKPEPFLNQDYEQLKQYCLIQGVRFIDKMFPPDQRSIGGDVLKPADLSRVEWLRPAVRLSFEPVAERCLESTCMKCVIYIQPSTTVCLRNWFQSHLLKLTGSPGLTLVKESLVSKLLNS